MIRYLQHLLGVYVLQPAINMSLVPNAPMHVNEHQSSDSIKHQNNLLLLSNPQFNILLMLKNKLSILCAIQFSIMYIFIKTLTKLFSMLLSPNLKWMVIGCQM